MRYLCPSLGGGYHRAIVSSHAPVGCQRQLTNATILLHLRFNVLFATVHATPALLNKNSCIFAHELQIEWQSGATNTDNYQIIRPRSDMSADGVWLNAILCTCIGTFAADKL